MIDDDVDIYKGKGDKGEEKETEQDEGREEDELSGGIEEGKKEREEKRGEGIEDETDIGEDREEG